MSGADARAPFGEPLGRGTTFFTLTTTNMDDNTNIWPELVGHTLLAIHHDDDLYLTTNKGVFKSEAHGD